MLAALDAAMARILTGPVTNLYAALWRSGILTTTNDTDDDEEQP